MDLKTYNQLWHEILYEGADHSDKLKIKSDRMEVYQSFVFDHYQSSLKNLFSRTDFFLDLDWDEITNAYLAAYEARAWDLNDFCLNFPKFFKQHFKDKFEECFYELIEYEVSEFFNYKKLVQDTEKGIRLNPARDLLVFEYDIASWIQDSELKEDPTSRPEKVQNALVIARDPETLMPVFTKLPPLGMMIYQFLNEKPVIGSEYEMFEVVESIYSLPPSAATALKEVYQAMVNQKIILF